MFPSRPKLAIAALLGAAALAPQAHAALLGVTNGAYSDVTLGNSVILYDSNYQGSGTGRLVVVAVSSRLRNPSGTLTTAQTYSGGADTQPYEEMLTINVNNQTGAFISGTVSINRGNSTSAQGFTWNGTITNFGFSANGNVFDATWQMNSGTAALPSDRYFNLGTGFANYTTNALSGTPGGIILALGNGGLGSAMTGASGWFNRDWMFGTGASASNASLASIASSLGLSLTSTYYSANSVTGDVFVPLPAPLLLLGSSLLAAAAALRRRQGLA